jgi:hypothetical protein
VEYIIYPSTNTTNTMYGPMNIYIKKERLDYLSILSIDNDITKSMSYEEAIKDSMQPQIIGNKALLRCARQFICMEFVKFVVFVRVFKFLICCDFISLYK